MERVIRERKSPQEILEPEPEKEKKRDKEEGKQQENPEMKNKKKLKKEQQFERFYDLTREAVEKEMKEEYRI